MGETWGGATGLDGEGTVEETEGGRHPHHVRSPQHLAVVAPIDFVLVANSVIVQGAPVRQTWNWVTFCDPVTRESSDPVTLFYNELQMSTYA